MKKTFFALILLLLPIFTFNLHAQEKDASDLLPVCKGSRCGFVNRSGAVVIKPRFVSVEEFSEGLAAVSVKIKGAEKYGFIDATGKIIIKPQFQMVWNFSDGLARFRMTESGDDGFIDKTGRIVVEAKLDQAESFSEGLARVSETTKIEENSKRPSYLVRSGFINTDGKVVIPIKFTDSSSFSEGLAVACESKGKCGFIDKNGGWIIKPQFTRAEPFSEGLAAVNVNRNGGHNWGYVNKNGEMVIEPKFYQARPFSEGLTAVNTLPDTKWGYINKTGKLEIPFQFYLLAENFSEGLADVYVGGGADSPKYGYIDRTGKRVSDKTYSITRPFKNGLARVEKFDLFARIDLPFINSLGKSEIQYIDRSEKIIWKGKTSNF